VRAVLGHPRVFELQQRLSAGGLIPLRRWLAAMLRPMPDERVLDLCCGPGRLADLVPGPYVGLDLDARSIAHARARWAGDPRKTFLVGDAGRAAFRPKAFAKALFVDGLHHLPDADAARALATLAAVTRDAVAIADPATETPRLVSRVLQALDLGRHIRPRRAQRALIERAGLVVEREEAFDSGLAHQRVYLCRPPQ
jgi:demethylmenaquinone methyltransferase/2-methoxy-6-polyprenyl-1,4-benzoquinol methylase